MSIEGRIAIDVSFSDTASGTGMQALKRLALTSTDAYASGKVALITGTMTTAGASINLAPTTYEDSSGAAVSFASVSQIAFSCSRRAYVSESPALRLFSSGGNRVAVGEPFSTAASSVSVSVDFTSGTASYSLAVVGT
jgi:hypothetical protein